MGVPASGLVLTLKWIVLAVKTNMLHNLHLNGCPRKNWKKSRWNFRSPKIHGLVHKIGKMGIYLLRSSFDVKNGSFLPSGPTGSIANVLADVQDKFGQKWYWNFGSPKYLWTIVHENHQNKSLPAAGLIWHWKWTILSIWTTRSIANILMNVHEKFWQK